MQVLCVPYSSKSIAASSSSSDNSCRHVFLVTQDKTLPYCGLQQYLRHALLSASYESAAIATATSDSSQQTTSSNGDISYAEIKADSSDTIGKFNTKDIKKCYNEGSRVMCTVVARMCSCSAVSQLLSVNHSSLPTLHCPSLHTADSTTHEDSSGTSHSSESSSPCVEILLESNGYSL